MKKGIFPFLLILFVSAITACNNSKVSSVVRMPVDTVGFAQYCWQMDSIMKRIAPDDKVPVNYISKAVICPHDDYAYTAGLYTKSLAGVKAPLVMLVGVAHKAKLFGLQDRLVFGSFDAWKAPCGDVNVSVLRDSVLALLSPETFIVHDSMMTIEHSLEALVPFIRYSNKEAEIIPVLVPYMTFDDMERFSDELASVLSGIMRRRNMKLGRDFAIVISNDALHYGDQDWGSADMAPFGCDSAGNALANKKDLEIISGSLTGELSDERIRSFFTSTVSSTDYKVYAWTWCGRYSVPFGLLLANKLNSQENEPALQGELLDYRSSILSPHIRVDDIGMGTTAPANEHHWVSYVGISYR